MKAWLVGCVVIFILSGCQSTKDEDDLLPFQGKTAQEIFVKAETSLAGNNYNEAIKAFEALAAMYPDGPQARQGLEDLVFAYYQAEDYPSAVASADHYIQLYPLGKNVDYVYYLRGMANVQTGRSMIQNVFHTDPSKRDESQLYKAYDDFNAIVTRFPQSRYAHQAQQQMVRLRNDFADHHLDIARFYQKRGAYIACINRAKVVIKNFPHSNQARIAQELIEESDKHLTLQ